MKGNASGGRGAAAFFSAAALHIGIDEAGRGCLAGPVAAAAVLFPVNYDFAARLPGLDDSKKLKEEHRYRLAALITDQALAYGVGLSWQDEVDSVNVLNATFRAMSRAVFALCERWSEARDNRISLPPLLIDGRHCIPDGQWRACAKGLSASHLSWEQYFPLPISHPPSRPPDLPEQRAVVGGDSLLPSISAASVLAKTVRDDIMIRLDKFFPGYGLARHKGYGTKAHYAALAKLGHCRLHRLSFRGVRPADKEEKTPSPLGFL